MWTKDVHRAHRVAAPLSAGSVWINAYRVVAPSVPFGGFKHSGLGRENGIHAIDEYLEEKAIWVELSGGAPRPLHPRLTGGPRQCRRDPGPPQADQMPGHCDPPTL